MIRKTLLALASFLTVIMTYGVASAQEHAAAAYSSGGYSDAMYAISAALTIAIAAAFGSMGQAKAATAALEGIGRNPGAAGKVQTPMIIALALIESLVIYALVIAFMLQGKIG